MEFSKKMGDNNRGVMTLSALQVIILTIVNIKLISLLNSLLLFYGNNIAAIFLVCRLPLRESNVGLPLGNLWVIFEAVDVSPCEVTWVFAIKVLILIHFQYICRVGTRLLCDGFTTIIRNRGVFGSIGLDWEISTSKQPQSSIMDFALL